jgi:hypothetical protein
MRYRAIPDLKIISETWDALLTPLTLLLSHAIASLLIGSNFS